MATKVWTMAIFDVRKRRWVAALTSPVRSRIEAVCEVVSELIPASYCAVVEVERDEVELIETLVAALPVVDVVQVWADHWDIAQVFQDEARRIAEEAQPLATGRASLH